MATPSEIRNETLKKLRQTFQKMCSAEWDLAIADRPQEERTKAALEFARVQRARLRLENAQLAEIRDKIVENEADLEAGRERLTWALAHLEEVKEALTAVSSFLDVVARLVPMA